MSTIFTTTPKEIGGRTFNVRTLAFGEARKVYSRLQRLLAANDDVLAESGAGLFMFAGLAGAISDDDLKFYIDTFGAATTVAISPTQTLDLGSDTKRDVVFSGRFNEVFEWLDFCVEVNFAAVVAKLRGVRQALEARQQQKTAQE